MADMREMVDLMSEGGPAQSIQAGEKGFEAGRAASIEERKRKLQDELTRSGYITGGQANTLSGEKDLFPEERSLPTSIISELGKLRPEKPKPIDPLDVDLKKAKIRALDQSAASSKKAREQADKKIQQTEDQPRRQAETKARKDVQDAQASFNQLVPMIESIRKAAALLPVHKSGGYNQAKGRLKMAYKTFSKDPATEKYLGKLAQGLSPIVRGIGQEKGPLTDKDIERIMLGLGELTTPPETREELLNELVAKATRSMDARKSNLSSVTTDATSDDAPATTGGLDQAFIDQMAAQGLVFEGVEE